MNVYAALDDRVLAIDVEEVGDGEFDATWTAGLVDVSLECLGASPGRPERLFVGTVERGLQRSEDGGRTWKRVASFGDRLTAVTVSPHDPDVVLAGTEPSAVYRSADGGSTWEARDGLADLPSADRWSFPPRPHTHHVRWLEVDPHDPTRVYVGIEAGAFVRTTDGGDSWEDHPPGARRDNHTLATHPDAPGRVYAAAGDGYAESHDGGATWQTRHEGLDHGYVWGLAVDAGDPDRVVVSAAHGARSAHTPSRANSQCYRLVDGTWERGLEGLPEPDGTVRAVLAGGTTPGEFGALTNRGLYLSRDGAASWHRLPVEFPDERVGRGLALV